MQAYRVETTVSEDGVLTLENLPFHAGETIEVIILAQPVATRPGSIPLSMDPIKIALRHTLGL